MNGGVFTERKTSTAAQRLKDCLATPAARDMVGGAYREAGRGRSGRSDACFVVTNASTAAISASRRTATMLSTHSPHKFKQANLNF